jgi:hypothetical protein
VQFFGWLTDRLGRKALFLTLTVYLTATAARRSPEHCKLCIFRFLTGAGIGGEYSRSIHHSGLVPARVRGWTTIINGSFWIGRHSARWAL